MNTSMPSSFSAPSPGFGAAAVAAMNQFRRRSLPVQRFFSIRGNDKTLDAAQERLRLACGQIELRSP